MRLPFGMVVSTLSQATWAAGKIPRSFRIRLRSSIMINGRRTHAVWFVLIKRPLGFHPRTISMVSDR
jgi:hypothetical protein